MDFTRASVSQLRQQLEQGRCTVAEIVEAHIARLADRAALNAVVVPRYEAAREAARQADRRRETGAFRRPLHGIPVTIKESLDLGDTPSTFGLPSRERHRAGADDPRVARLRAAGAIVLGKTNVAQALLYTEADNPVYGRTLHPEDAKRTAGGSSGGEAAAISVGGSVLGLATDIGGSCRIPAHFCGVVGFKPTTGLLPDTGRASLPLGQQAIPSSLGLLARDVESLIAGMQVVVEEEETPQLFRADRSHSMGFFVEDGLFAPCPAVRQAVEEAALCCRAEPWSPLEPERALRLYFQILSADGSRLLKETLAGNPINANLKPLLRFTSQPRWLNRLLGGALGLFGQRSLAGFVSQFGDHDTASYWRKVESLLELRGRYLESMPSVVLCPPYPLPAIHHGSSGVLTTGGLYAPLANLLGCPAGVVPWTRVRPEEESRRPWGTDYTFLKAKLCERGSAGLPIGVQVIGRPGCDSEVLRVMKWLETYRKEHSEHVF